MKTVDEMSRARARNRPRLAPGFLDEPTDPVNLAVFRIVVFASLFFTTLDQDSVWFSRLPEELMMLPFGTAWLPTLPISPAIVSAAKLLLLAAALLAAVGWRTRLSAGIACLLGLYVLGIPQLYGKVDHYHYILWFGFLVALSPAGDALSVDAWRRGGPRPAPAAVYARPIRLAWILIGLLYLFPGFWKLVLVGPEWALGDNVRNHLWLKWMEFEEVPGFRIDRYPILYQLGGLATLAFEISFVFLVLFRRIRPFLAVAGVGFHVATWITMRIFFWPLVLVYATFLDWSRFLPAKSHAGTRAPSSRGRFLEPAGAALYTLNFVFGFLGVHSWPISNFPTFASQPPPLVEIITVEARMPDGQGREIGLREVGWPAGSEHRLKALMYEILREGEEDLRTERLASLWTVIEREHPELERATRVYFYADRLSTNPADRGAPPIERALLHEFVVTVDDQGSHVNALKGGSP